LAFSSLESKSSKSPLAIDFSGMPSNSPKLLTIHSSTRSDSSNTSISFWLKINPKHPLVKKLKTKISQDVVKVLFDQAVLSEGGQLKEPAEFVKRMNKLIK
jgi:HSP90 family molecular chaperone